MQIVIIINKNYPVVLPRVLAWKAMKNKVQFQGVSIHKINLKKVKKISLSN